MTFDEWRESYHPDPLMNEGMARSAWDAAVKAERDACAKLCDDERPNAPWTFVNERLEGWFEMAGYLSDRIRERSQS